MNRRRETVRLIARVREGDAEAEAALLALHDGLVLAAVNHWQSFRSALTADDLYQEGRLGLLTAIRRYEPARAEFSTYARFWIRQRIARAIMEAGYMIRLPVRLYELRWQRDRAQEGARPMPALTPHASRMIARWDAYPLSLSTGGEEGTRQESLVDWLVAEEQTEETVLDRIEKEEKARPIREAIDKLSPEQRQLVQLYFGMTGGHPMPCSEIADRLGRTRQAISARKRAAFESLRRLLE